MQATINLWTCNATRAPQIDQKHLVSIVYTLTLHSSFGHKSITMQDKTDKLNGNNTDQQNGLKEKKYSAD